MNASASTVIPAIIKYRGTNSATVTKAAHHRSFARTFGCQDPLHVVIGAGPAVLTRYPYNTAIMKNCAEQRISIGSDLLYAAGNRCVQSRSSIHPKEMSVQPGGTTDSEQRRRDMSTSPARQE